MSDFTIAYVPPRAVEQSLFPVLAFVALLLLIFVGLDAFSPPVQAFGTGHGDAIRPFAYLSVAGLIGIAAVQRFGLGALRALPVSMALLLAWCLASALWTPQTDIVLRRAGLEVVLVLSLLLSVETVGAGRAFAVWRWLLGAILLVNFVSISLIPAARHGLSEIDPVLAGNWRGLYGHKNIAGAMCAITAILFLFSKTGWRNCIGIAIAAAACGFLVMTHSRSSAGFLVVSLAAGFLYRIGWRDGLSRAILLAVSALLVAALASFALLDADHIAHALEDPAEFSGRTAIWAAELRTIADHPLLGAGFGVGHGHNGYLQVLVAIGGIGFLLAILALLMAPARRFWTLDLKDDAFKPMLLALFIFAILHNFMESDFLEGDSIVWSSLLLVIAALNVTARRQSLTGR
jgi:O-antigen ligase